MKENAPRFGYMDMIDWRHELGRAMDGSRVYPSAKDLKRFHPSCVNECGIVKVKVTFVKVVKKQRLSHD